MFNTFVFGRKQKVLLVVATLIIILLVVLFIPIMQEYLQQQNNEFEGKNEYDINKQHDGDALKNLDIEEIEQVVDPYQVYTYDDMESDLVKLQDIYGNIMEKKVIGKSVLGNDIYAVGLGSTSSNNNIMIEASHHAREWIATNLTMKKIDEYLQAYVKDESIEEYNVRDVLDEVGIWFIPMVNPDGVTLHQKGLNGIPEEYHHKFVDYNVDWAGTDFYLWKANINGVDLNRQYPADWEKSDCTGVRHAMNFKGEEPLSEPEAEAVYYFTKEIEPLATLSYHTRGRVIFWYYHNKHIVRDEKIGEELSKLTGYELYPARPSYKGANFNDWFIQEYDRPGYILELVPFAEDEEHEDLEFMAEEWENNKEVGIFLSNIARTELK